MAGNIGPRKVTTSGVPPVPLPPNSTSTSVPGPVPVPNASPPKVEQRPEFETKQPEAGLFRPPGLPQEGLPAMQVHQLNLGGAQTAPSPAQAPPPPAPPTQLSTVVTVTPLPRPPAPIETDSDGALDFSVKRRSSPPPQPVREPLVLRKQHAHLPPVSEPPPAHSNPLTSNRPPDFGEYRVGGAYPPSMFARRSPLLPETTSSGPVRSRQASPLGPPQQPGPKPMPPGKLMMPASGSITHGTPVNTVQHPTPIPVPVPVPVTPGHGPGSMVPSRIDGQSLLLFLLSNHGFIFFLYIF